MGKMLCHSACQAPESPFDDGIAVIGRVPVNPFYALREPPCSGAASIWMDGEILFCPDLKHYKMTPEFSALLLAGIMEREAFDELAELNGYFAAVAYHPQRHTLYLISDRFGLRHLFYRLVNDGIIWSSEQKGFLADPAFPGIIERAPVGHFLQRRHLAPGQCWFTGVRMLEPASVLKFDLHRGGYELFRYWDWRKKKREKSRFNLNDLSDIIHFALTCGICMRSRAGGETMISLSGGLDSRFILAAAPDRPPGGGDWRCFTFGERDCDDINIARQAANVKHARHQVITLSANDGGIFIEARRPAVWWCDGMISLLDIWYNDYYRRAIEGISVNLNGFLGDAVVGGSYLKEGVSSVFEEVEGRGRMMIATGLRMGLAMGVEQRLPFMDARWIDLLSGIDQSLLRGADLYHKMLLKYYPEYYDAIPWQTTGAPISAMDTAPPTQPSPRRKMTDYYRWINLTSKKEYIRRLLTSSDCLLAAYLEQDVIRFMVTEGLADSKQTPLILGMVTLELWLRNVRERGLC